MKSKKAFLNMGKIISSFFVLLIIIIIMTFFYFISAGALFFKKPFLEESVPISLDNFLALSIPVKLKDGQIKKLTIRDVNILLSKNKVRPGEAYSDLSSLLDSEHNCIFFRDHAGIVHSYYYKNGNVKQIRDDFEKKKLFSDKELIEKVIKVDSGEIRVLYYYGYCKI